VLMCRGGGRLAAGAALGDRTFVAPLGGVRERARSAPARPIFSRQAPSSCGTGVEPTPETEDSPHG
jgi:hypothetical protein